MNTFSLILCDSLHDERFDDVAHFIGADDSGAFGVLPHHAAMVAVLRYGLARFQDSAGKWHYLALPGGVLHFSGDALTIVAERYFIGDQRELLADQLAAEMSREDSDLHTSRATLAEIEHALISRLSELSERAAGAARP